MTVHLQLMDGSEVRACGHSGGRWTVFATAVSCDACKVAGWGVLAEWLAGLQDAVKQGRPEPPTPLPPPRPRPPREFSGKVRKLWRDVPKNKRITEKWIRREYGGVGNRDWWSQHFVSTKIETIRKAKCSAATPWYGGEGMWRQCSLGVLDGEEFCRAHGGRFIVHIFDEHRRSACGRAGGGPPKKGEHGREVMCPRCLAATEAQSEPKVS